MSCNRDETLYSGGKEKCRETWNAVWQATSEGKEHPEYGYGRSIRGGKIRGVHDIGDRKTISLRGGRRRSDAPMKKEARAIKVGRKGDGG